MRSEQNRSAESVVGSASAARITRAVLVACAILATGVIVRAADTPAVQKLLPSAKQVAGFGITKDSLVYGKGADLTNIYDGGYELYTKAGVIDAAKQMYQRGNDYVEVVVHTMKSDKTALDFLKYWAKQRGGKLASSKTHSGFTVIKPNVTGYYVFDRYFVTVSAYYPSAKPADADAFLQAVRENWRKTRTP